MRGFFQSSGIVAGQEWADAFRSRRALVLLVLYFVGALAATLLFIKVLHQVENQVESAVGISQSRQAGASTSALWRSHAFREGLIKLAGDDALARDLLTLPPLALFYGWLSFAFTPLLVILLSSARIAEEVWSGSVRFAMFRVSRGSWVFGKLTGQAAQLLVALLASGAAAWAMGWWRLAGFDPVANALVILLFALKAWVYAFAWLGVALAVSQLLTSPTLASVFGLIALMALAAVSGLAAAFTGPGWRSALDLVRMLTPGGHEADLWRLDTAHAVPAVLFLLALGLAYTAAGYARFGRRDL